MEKHSKKLVLFSTSGILLLFMFLPLSFASSTHVNVAIDTSEVCDYSHLNVNIDLHYNYDAIRAKLKVYVDGEYERTIYIRRGERLNFYLSLDDLDDGWHELYIKYYIYNGDWFDDYLVDDGSVSVPFYVYCPSPHEEDHESYSLPHVRNILLYASKHDVIVGDVIRVYGYVDADTDVSVRFYLNYRYIGAVKTSNGYFEKYLRIEKEGNNLIEVRTEDKSKSTDIYARKIEAQHTEENEEEQTSNTHTLEMSEEQGDVNIVIHNGSVRIYYGEDNKENNKNTNNDIHQGYVKYEYVDVQVSTKQLDMLEGKGNLIKVKVLNHMNESKLFSINTSINDIYVYLPSPKVLNVRQQGEFDIYLKPSIKREGSNRINATIYIYMNNKEIKKIPIDIFIIKRRYQEREAREAFIDINFSFYELAALMLLFLFVFSLAYISIRKRQREEMLKPRYYTPIEGKTM